MDKKFDWNDTDGFDDSPDKSKSKCQVMIY